jgi:hypothetical protein
MKRRRRVVASAVLVVLSVAAASWPALGWAQAPAVSRARPESKANALLTQFEEQSRVAAFKDPWAQTLKDIVALGGDAVPDLIAELDATNNDMMLRALGFTLRAIGDKRAVPALIRAIPRTLRRPGSDMGCKADDKELLAFMQAHDLNDEDRDGMYGFGRPVREIGGALQTLTGQKHGEDELNFVMLGGALQQQLAQRRLYYRCAERWTAWWEKNWKAHVGDEQYAKVDLPPGDDPPAIEFPHGAGQYQLGSAMSGCIVESDAAPKGRCVLMDFDTGRMVPFPEQLRKLADDPHRLDKIQDWAAREGFDVMGTEYHAAGEAAPRFVVRALGISAWEIDEARWFGLSGEISQDAPIKLGRPASGLLMHYDEKTQQYDSQRTAVFLFVTRDGAYGALRIGVEVHDTDMKDRIGKPVMGDIDLDPKGFFKGRRLSYQLVESMADAARPIGE